jgi:carbon monoxide dehydrogenase subunit G
MSIELNNSFTVPVPPDVAWKVLLDVARIAPCMPGATVESVDGDVVTGGIKVKVGPVQLTYRGTATFTERDESARTMLVQASGKETRGAGTASATVKASLTPADDGATLVEMHTSMNVTGRPAQFGRGVMVEVGGKLVDKFADNLATLLAADGAADAPAEEATAEVADETAGTAEAGAATPAAGAATPAAGAPKPAVPGPAKPAAATAPAPEESLNLVRLVGPAVLKRVVPVAAIVAALALLGRRIRRGLRSSGRE